MRYGLLFLLCLLANVAQAVEFDEYTTQRVLGQEMDVFEDVRGDATINDITSPALQANFRRHDKPVLNAGYSHSVFWLRVDLAYRPQALLGQQPWLLELAYPPLDHLDLYLPDGAGGYRLAQRTGDTLAFSSRPISLTNYLFDLKL
ncbi:MAG: 7TM-DISM domain-containing protein, partial [Pseudomonas sp.]